MGRLAAVVALAAATLAIGCKQHGGPRVYVQPHYAPTADGLRGLWSDILDAAKKDDRDRVHDLMASTLVSDADMKRLFGAKAEALLPRYHMLMGTLINRGSVELVANVYEHKYDAVDAFPAEDAAIAAALVEPHPLFAARVRKASEERGLRYDGYFVLDGTWKTFNLLGKFIDVVEPSAAKAGEPKPAEAKPTEPKPSESKAGEPKPGAPKAAEAKPTEAKPAEAKPTEAKPAAGKPSAPPK